MPRSLSYRMHGYVCLHVHVVLDSCTWHGMTRTTETCHRNILMREDGGRSFIHAYTRPISPTMQLSLLHVVATCVGFVMVEDEKLSHPRCLHHASSFVIEQKSCTSHGNPPFPSLQTYWRKGLPWPQGHRPRRGGRSLGPRRARRTEGGRSFLILRGCGKKQ